MSDSDEERKACLNCQASFEGLKRCPKCKAVYFCNAACQREVWKAHCKVCVAPEGTVKPSTSASPAPAPAQKTAAAAGAAAAGRAPTHAAAGEKTGTSAPMPSAQMTAEEKAAEEERVKQEELHRIKHEVLPEVDRLMRGGEKDIEEAVEHLEDGVAFASGYGERDLLDSLSCLVARAYLRLGKPKEALMGLNPALMHARREGGPGAVRPHSIAAEAFKALGDHDKMRVELRALMEAAVESKDEAEQGKALLLAGCLMHDVGDLNAAVPLLASAAAAGEKMGDFSMRAGARNRAGAALLRMRRPQQALEAWADELKALEDGEQASEKAKEAAGKVAAKMETLAVKEDNSTADATPKDGLTAPPQPIGDTRSRRCKAHGNMFMAHLLLGPTGRTAAEQHLQHALSLARQLDSPDEEEARVWLQAGNAHHLASSEGGGEEAENAWARALELAKKAGAGELVASAERALAHDVDEATLLK